MVGLLSIFMADGYDPLDPTGNITIKWDIMQGDVGNYVVSSSLLLFFRTLDYTNENTYRLTTSHHGNGSCKTIRLICSFYVWTSVFSSPFFDRCLMPVRPVCPKDVWFLRNPSQDVWFPLVED